MMNQVIILAGGKGKRMGVDFPKVLQKIGNKTIIERLLENVKEVCPKSVVVVGYKAEIIKSELGEQCEYVLQRQQFGTGHAVKCAEGILKNRGIERIIVLPGDHPLVSAKTIKDLIFTQKETGVKIVLATAKVPNFEGDFQCFYNCGRIIRDKNGDVEAIVELKDASEEQKNIKELNVSYYCFEAKWLWENIDDLENDNVAQEFYLTDMVKIAVSQKQKVVALTLENVVEGMGANTIEQLETIEKYIS